MSNFPQCEAKRQLEQIIAKINSRQYQKGFKTFYIFNRICEIAFYFFVMEISNFFEKALFEKV